MSDIKVDETTEYESCLDFESDDINDVSKFMDGEQTQEEKLPVVEALVTLILFDPVHFIDGIMAPPSSHPNPVI